MADDDNYNEIEKKATAKRRLIGDAAMQRQSQTKQKELLAVELAWRSDFKNGLKEVKPTFQPSEELIDKYRLRNYSTVSDAIHAWLRQREEVLSISSDSTSANPEGVTRKKSSTTETSSDRQQELKKKKPKSDKNSDVESIISILSGTTILSLIHI